MPNKKGGLKAVAILEASKGLISLFVGLGIHELAGENSQKMLESLLGHLHLNPASHLPSILLHETGLVNNSNLTLIALGAIVYSVVRLVEAYGLWNGLAWTEWFALLSGAIYLPFEIYEVIAHMGSVSIIVLSINVAIVWYMYSLLMGSRQET
tara:strand:- start:90973 stop:91431 length:459 start_codon:yes stop_codon:yes gene_type:complete